MSPDHPLEAERLIADAIDAAEDIRDPLEGLDEKTAADPGAAFAPDVLERLAALKREDRAAFEALRSQLKKAGCRVTALDEAIAEENGDAGGRGAKQADILIELAQTAELLRTPDGNEGGYVIWWLGVGLPVISEMPVALWPHWLCHQLSHSQRPIASRITVPDDHALAGLVRLISGAREGERNNLTYWAACRAGEMVASGLLRTDAAVAIIAEAARRAGLSREEAERAAWSGIRRTGGLPHA
jgi:hypothetical protein